MSPAAECVRSRDLPCAQPSGCPRGARAARVGAHAVVLGVGANGASRSSSCRVAASVQIAPLGVWSATVAVLIELSSVPVELRKVKSALPLSRS